MMPRHTWPLLLAACLPLTAHAFSLTWPAACTDGVDCFTQNMVDHDPSPSAKDFNCTSHTYDKHDGTDIRLKNFAAMRAGVPVLAPADGVVQRIRDGVADTSIRGADGVLIETEALKQGKDCGNAVVIAHAEGYKTMLCHMREGSVLVRPGQAVKAGDVLGMIGLSGRTEFPHVHLTVWKNDVVQDPYTGTALTEACGTPKEPLWSTPHPFRPTVLLGDGFTLEVPDEKTMGDTPIALTTAETTAPALLYWVSVMGTEAGDMLTLRIANPQGKTYAETSKVRDTNAAGYFIFVGKRNSKPLMPGTYTATVKVERAGGTLSNTRTITIR